MQVERMANNLKEGDINEWVEYKCKSGQTLFIKVSGGGNKWPHENESSNEVGKFKSFCSISTQTDDTGCQNSCTSMYINTSTISITQPQITTSHDNNPTHTSMYINTSTTSIKQPQITTSHDNNPTHTSMYINTSTKQPQITTSHDNNPTHTSMYINTSIKQPQMTTSTTITSSTSDDNNPTLKHKHNAQEPVIANSSLTKQTSSLGNTYANDLSAVLRVLEEDFDSSGEPEALTTVTLNTQDVHISEDNIHENGQNTVKIENSGTGEGRTEVEVLPNEQRELPSMIKEDTSLNEQFQCMVCKEVFNCKETYSQHLLTHRSYKCPHCGKEYSYKFYLKYHLITHTQKKQLFNCQFCDKEFVTREELEEHIHIHIGETPYICTVCDKSFKTRNNFRAHQQRVHTDGRKYKCTYCHQAFLRSDHLHRHLRKHTGEKPHQCIFCGKAFGRKDNLTCHLRTHMK